MRLQLQEGNATMLALWTGWVRLLLKVIRERTLWLALGGGLVLLVLAYQSPRSLFLDIGGPYDTPHTPGFNQPEQSDLATFRWSTAASSLYFPGIGRPLKPFAVVVQLSSGRSAGSQPLDVAVAVNGHPVPPLKLSTQSTSYSIQIDPSWIDPVSGDVRIDFATPTFKSGADKRDLGFIADFARISLPASPTIPPLGQLAMLLVSGLLLYWLARGTWLRPLPSGMLAFALLLVSALVIAVQRLMLTVFTTQMAATLLLALALVVLTEPLARALARLAGWTGARRLPEWAWAGLRALVIISAVLKVGGLLYPHTNIVDAYFHLKEITYMAEGRPWEQFFGKNLALSVMPKEEWGEARAFIPYSPFFYVVAAPLVRLPWPKEISVPVAAALLDSMRVAFVFLFALALGRNKGAGRRALAAAAVFTFFPANFLLQQWGNWPTQISLWLATVWAAITCLFWNRMGRLAWLVSTLVLSLTLLSYTVTAVYMGIFVALLVVGGWLFVPGERRKWALVLASLVAASVVSLVVFYGQYIPTIIDQTLPTFGQAVNEQGKLTTLRPSMGAFITGTVGTAMQSYDLAIPYALATAGAAWVFISKARRNYTPAAPQRFGIIARFSPVRVAGRTTTWTHVWLAAWLLCFPIITLADFYVDQALKEFWFAIPAICVVAGLWLLAMGRKGLASRVYSLLVALLWATLAWQSLSLWVFRLLFHNR